MLVSGTPVGRDRLRERKWDREANSEVLANVHGAKATGAEDSRGGVGLAHRVHGFLERPLGIYVTTYSIRVSQKRRTTMRPQNTGVKFYH